MNMSPTHEGVLRYHIHPSGIWYFLERLWVSNFRPFGVTYVA